MNLLIAALLAAQPAPATKPPVVSPRAESVKPAKADTKAEEPAKPLFQPTEVKTT